LNFEQEGLGKKTDWKTVDKAVQLNEQEGAWKIEVKAFAEQAKLRKIEKPKPNETTKADRRMFMHIWSKLNFKADGGRDPNDQSKFRASLIADFNIESTEKSKKGFRWCPITRHYYD
jgi:hypothetical protein